MMSDPLLGMKLMSATKSGKAKPSEPGARQIPRPGNVKPACGVETRFGRSAPHVCQESSGIRRRVMVLLEWHEGALPGCSAQFYIPALKAGRQRRSLQVSKSSQNLKQSPCKHIAG